VPTLASKADTTTLWPPSGELRGVTIQANAADNSGSFTLAATVESSEDDGSPEPDCYVESIDQATGMIVVQLRAERSVGSDGRAYTVTITATDASENHSSATVQIRVPHDRRKK
jgi:hypothetical protein